jgi:hypothetical protein
MDGTEDRRVGRVPVVVGGIPGVSAELIVTTY